MCGSGIKYLPDSSSDDLRKESCPSCHVAAGLPALGGGYRVICSVCRGRTIITTDGVPFNFERSRYPEINEESPDSLKVPDELPTAIES
jgi:hypothetical protein